jgi:hypothetical protein
VCITCIVSKLKAFSCSTTATCSVNSFKAAGPSTPQPLDSALLPCYQQDLRLLGWHNFKQPKAASHTIIKIASAYLLSSSSLTSSDVSSPRSSYFCSFFHSVANHRERLEPLVYCRRRCSRPPCVSPWVLSWPWPPAPRPSLPVLRS